MFEDPQVKHLGIAQPVKRKDRQVLTMVGQPFSEQCAHKAAFKGKQAKMSGFRVKIGCIWAPYDDKHPAAFAPSAQGGADWNPSAYNPNTQLQYVCAADSDIAQLGIAPAKQNASYLAGRAFFGIQFGGFHFYRGFVKRGHRERV